MLACHKGHEKVVEALLGADPRAKIEAVDRVSCFHPAMPFTPDSCCTYNFDCVRAVCLKRIWLADLQMSCFF